MLTDESSVPFYVGKGHGKRMDSHEREARRGCTEPRHKKIRSLWSKGQSVQKVVIFETENEAEAFEMEKDFIGLIGRGNLCNCTDGGEGPSGLVHSQDFIERFRRMMTGNKYNAGRRMSPELRAKLRALDWKAIGLKAAATNRLRGNFERMAARRRGKPGPKHTEEAKAKVRRNRAGGGISGFVGVYPNNSGFFARFYRDMRPVYVGNFKTAQAASIARSKFVAPDGTLLC